MEQGNEINSKVLKTTSPEILRLFERKANGDFLARQELIEMNLRAVTYIAKKYYFSIKLPLKELISIGNLGLIRAVDNYIPELGRFEDFMFLCIDHEFKNFIKDETWQKHKPKGKIISLQDSCCGPDNEAIYEDFIPDLNTNAEEEALTNLTREELEELMKERLTMIESQVLRFRFGFINNDCYTCQEIGDILGFSRQRVNKIEQEALNKLKQYIKFSTLKASINNKKV